MTKNTLNEPKPSFWLRLAIPICLIVIWTITTAVGGPYFGKISEVATNDMAGFLPKSSESTKVNDQLEKFRSSDTIPATVVFYDDKNLSEAQLDELDNIADEIGSIAGVEGDISPPIISEDEKAALIVVPFSKDAELEESFAELRSAVDETTDIEYKIGGPASFSKDLQEAFSEIDVTLLAVALGVVFVILLIVYRSPILPFIVLLTSVSALTAAVLVVYYLAKAGVFTINGQVQGILFILVIGAATDYSLLYLARLREELHNYRSKLSATIASLKGSFEPILAAGGTVTVGLLCLLFSDLESNKALGPVGGIGIGMAILAALTLLPSMLLLIGRRAFWPRLPEYDPKHLDTYESRHKLWGSVGQFVRKYPRKIWTITSALLLLACVGVFQFKAEGVPQSDVTIGYSEAREASEVIDKHFPGGAGAPAQVIVSQDKLNQVVEVIDADKGVDRVEITADDSPSNTMPVGEAKKELLSEITSEVSKERMDQLSELKASIAEELSGAPESIIDTAYRSAAENIPSVEEIVKEANPFAESTPRIVDDTALLQVTLADAADSREARDTIVRLRSDIKAVDNTALVGGISAIQYDTNEASFHDLRLIIPLILLAITIILAALLRSLVAPFVLLATTIVSFGSAMGVAALLFNNVFNFPGADPAVVLFCFVFLVALGIDYNIFLMSRVREETMLSGVRKGTIKGLVVTGGVITSAGIVLAATFAALAVIPILFLAQLAFIVAFGVLLDTIIVRSLLVPALTLEIGKLMWWPSKPKD